MHYIIVLADGWGYIFGGINVFNKLLCEAMAQKAKKTLIEIICIAPDIGLNDIEKAEAEGISLLSLNKEDLQNPKEIVSKLRKQYNIGEWDEVDWIGHDTYTDEIALRCRDEWKGSKCAVVHHMAYGKYYPLLNKDTKETEGKEKHQKNVLRKADYVFANGPVLTKNAQDIIGNKEKVKTIYPGIVDVKGARNYINNDFSVVTFGRVELDNGIKRNNTIIKQVYLAVAAWAEFAKTYLGAGDDTTMKVYGKNGEDQVDKELENILSTYSDSVYALSSIMYEKNREILLDDLAEFSVCLVLSLREGFGMTALEAVSAGVPLVVSKKSGFYAMLCEKHLENYVHGVEIQGKTEEPYFTDNDLKNVKAALYSIYKNQKKAKDDVFLLREKLKESQLTWEKCAEDVLKALDPDFEEEEEGIFGTMRHFDEIEGLYDNAKPMIIGSVNSSDWGIICLGEQVYLSVRQGAVNPADVDECLEYIKLAAYYNEKLPVRHKFKVRWMFLERINPSHVVGIEYLYHQECKPLYSKEDIKRLFYDEEELWSGIINTVQVRITKVNMSSDYYFENGPEYGGGDGYE